MTNEERAARYVELFNRYEAKGVSVRANVPLDADMSRDGNTVYLGVPIDRSPEGVWAIRGSA